MAINLVPAAKFETHQASEPMRILGLAAKALLRRKLLECAHIGMYSNAKVLANTVRSEWVII